MQIHSTLPPKSDFHHADIEYEIKHLTEMGRQNSNDFIVIICVFIFPHKTGNSCSELLKICPKY